jgi:hypothetical protein
MENFVKDMKWIVSLPFSSKIGTPPKTVAKQHHRKATVTKKTAK